MRYFLVGLFVVFIYFTCWAVINVNKIKIESKPKKEKPKKSPAPIVQEEEYILPKENKPKPVKIVRKEPISKEAKVETLFVEGKENDEDLLKAYGEAEKDDLYEKYIKKPEPVKEEKKKTDSFEDLDAELDRRIEEIKRRNAMKARTYGAGINQSPVGARMGNLNYNMNNPYGAMGMPQGYYGMDAQFGVQNGQTMDPRFNRDFNNMNDFNIESFLTPSPLNVGGGANIDVANRSANNAETATSNEAVASDEVVRTSRLGGGSVSKQVRTYQGATNLSAIGVTESALPKTDTNTDSGETGVADGTIATSGTIA